MTKQEYEQYLKDHPCEGRCEAWKDGDCTRNPYTEGCLDPVVQEYWDNIDKEKINVEFSAEEIDTILIYQERCGAETIQQAIMNAVTKDLN